MSEGDSSNRPFKCRRSRKKTAICEDDDEAAPGIIMQHFVHDGPEGEVLTRVEIPWKPIQSVGVDSTLLDCPTNREEEVMPMEEADTFLGAEESIPKVFKDNNPQILSYCPSISNLSTSKNL
jgi:hypothetical protein